MSGDKHMLQIGAVAKSFGVSENTIRRFEAAGLLTPARVTDGSGYRYYDGDNLLLLAELFSLKTFGFEYGDLQEYLRRPGDYGSLYDKLLEKQRAINLLVELFSRRLEPGGSVREETVELDETYCLCKDAVMRPERDAVSAFLKEFLYEAVAQGMPVDPSKTIQILTQCRDYREYGRFLQDGAQRLVCAIPLSREAGHENVRLFPACRAVNVSWNPAQADYPALLPPIDALFAQKGLVQNGVMRVIYPIGGLLSKEAAGSGITLRLLIPFSERAK